MAARIRRRLLGGKQVTRTYSSLPDDRPVTPRTVVAGSEPPEHVTDAPSHLQRVDAQVGRSLHIAGSAYFFVAIEVWDEFFAIRYSLTSPAGTKQAVRWAARDDTGLSYQVIGGGILTVGGITTGEQHFAPPPSVEARTLELQLRIGTDIAAVSLAL